MRVWKVTYTTDDSIIAEWKEATVYADDIISAINVVLQSQPENGWVFEIISVSLEKNT